MNTMKVVKHRWILITGVFSVILLSTLYLLEFQYLMPIYNIQFRQYYKFRSESPQNNINNDTLMDLEHFEYLINNASICTSSTVDHQSVVVIIHSARYNFMERYAVRGSWGSIKVYKGWTFHLAFILGNGPTSNEELGARLWEESQRYGDIIMGSFVDSYKNLTYKHLMGYKWAHSFCSNAKFILKTDDDVFVDIFQLVDVILVELTNSDKTYACQNMGGNKPMRNPKTIWYVSKDQYSGEYYPDFCSGGAYLMKSEVAEKIYSVCNQSNFFWIDDVYVTGILRDYYNSRIDNVNERLDILSLNNRYNFSCRDEIKKWCYTGLEQPWKYTFVLLHKYEIVRDMFCVWNKVRLLKFVMNNAIASDPN